MAEISTNLQELAAYWAGAKAGERANLQTYVIRLCRALMLPEPGYRGSGYEFELQIDAITVEGKESANFIDCWKSDCFALEGKDDAPGAKGKAANEALLRRAFGQVRNYVHHVPGAVPPPYLLVLDVGATLIVWDRWAGTYGGFEAGHRIDLATLHERSEDIALLRDIWLDPGARDRRGAAQAVTQEIAGTLAQLAAALEARGHDQEIVARFIMRVVFSCFAEDVGLLPAESFRQTVTEAGLKGSPKEFTEAIESLWRLMDAGGRVGPMKFLRFNGHFFKDATALPLTRDELALVETAARANWAEVEPSIFGTLLTRALDPEERHRLGAEYTPRAFIERLVRPTIEEPVLERWTAVQAEVVQLLATEKPKDRATAEARLLDFHAWLRSLRILDPACGSGNFLYVAMHALKRIEIEVLRSITRMTGQASLRMEEIGPANFLGLEVKPWAREIAELVLWIGFHQHWRRHHDVQPPEPILQDTKSLECRDAVLTWKAIVQDPTRARPDPTPRLRHPATGELVPDPAATLPYDEYVGAEAAAWPEADFVVGNPPYIGSRRMLTVLGDGYVHALRGAYPDVPDSADFVLFWWHRAAQAVASGRTLRAGLITTQSITQAQNRQVVMNARDQGVHVVWAVADHVWCDGADGAEVRVTMTVLSKEVRDARLVEVAYTRYHAGSDAPAVVREYRVPRLNADLSATADVAGATETLLRANSGLSSFGFMLNGPGFILEAAEAETLLTGHPERRRVIRPYRSGRDLAQRPRNVSLIDFGLGTERDAGADPVLLGIVRTRVKPSRDAARRPSVRDRWWRFAEARPGLRESLVGLRRYIATVETAVHRFFVFLDAEIAPDHTLIAIASDDAFHLGVLSSSLHVTWALAAGGALEDKPRYNKRVCLDPFPFPDPPAPLRAEIGRVAEALDRLRAGVIAEHPHVTMTGIYNVIEKVKAGTSLSAKERLVHRDAASETIRSMHEELDHLVSQAYGWSWPEPPALILERLVALHDQRVEEEQAGTIRWLRPEYQRPRFGSTDGGVAEARLELGDEGAGKSASATAAQAAGAPTVSPWPMDAIGQITALRTITATLAVTVEEAARLFVGARRDIVARHLETLALLGEVVLDAGDRYRLAVGALASI